MLQILLPLINRLTAARAAKLDNLDVTVSSVALSTAKNAKIDSLGSPYNCFYFESSGTFTVPSGIYRIYVMAVGGGGKGGNNTGGGGGGGGGFSYKAINTTPSTQYTVTVGGQSGTSSFGDNLVVAYGGASVDSNAGGAGASVGVGDVCYGGGNGGAGSTYGGGGGAAGCLGGTGGNGGAGTSTSGAIGLITAIKVTPFDIPFGAFSYGIQNEYGQGAAGANGVSGYAASAYGGGGGGSDTSGGTGGAGGPGIVLIYW